VIVAAIEKPPALLALDGRTGRTLWRSPLEEAPTTGPVVRERLIYVGTTGALEARKLLNGSVLWRSPIGGVAGPFALGRRWIAAITTTSELVFLAPGDGKVLKKEAGALPAAPPLRARESILYLTTRGLMLATPRSGGKPKRWMNISWLGTLTTPFVAVHDRVYFATDKRGLICAGKWKR
jgi:outer membrane protein assembly factor BamB